MIQTTFEQRRGFEQMDSEQLARHQLDRLNVLLQQILPDNHFYAEKLAGLRLPLESLDQLSAMPYTYKDELATAHRGDLAANLTWPLDRYTRFHRTSGTRGRPLVVPDTARDWQWWIDTWQYVLDVAGLESEDRALMAFSFGPFIGFWSAFDAVLARGALAIPGGGLSTLARLELIESAGVTALFCTPTYAMHLLEIAEQNQRNAASMGVSRIIVAGEPGGSVPAIRQRLESGWNARVIDHAGATEIGPWSYADSAGNGLHIIESEFIAEFLAIETGTPAGEGEVGRTGPDRVESPRGAGDPLPDRRSGASLLGHHARQPLRLPARRSPGPCGRYAGDPRCECLSDLRRPGPAQLSRGGRIPRHRAARGSDGYLGCGSRRPAGPTRTDPPRTAAASGTADRRAKRPPRLTAPLRRQSAPLSRPA
jgi:hypothetical protein